MEGNQKSQQPFVRSIRCYNSHSDDVTIIYALMGGLKSNPQDKDSLNRLWVDIREKQPGQNEIVFAVIDNGGDPPYITFGEYRTFLPELVTYWMRLTDVARVLKSSVGAPSWKDSKNRT